MFGYSLIFNEQDCQKIELHFYAGTYNLIGEKIIRLIVAISYSKNVVFISNGGNIIQFIGGGGGNK